jgi:hypothetical protein
MPDCQLHVHVISYVLVLGTSILVFYNKNTKYKREQQVYTKYFEAFPVNLTSFINVKRPL